MTYKFVFILLVTIMNSLVRFSSKSSITIIAHVIFSFLSFIVTFLGRLFKEVIFHICFMFHHSFSLMSPLQNLPSCFFDYCLCISFCCTILPVLRLSYLLCPFCGWKRGHLLNMTSSARRALRIQRTKLTRQHGLNLRTPNWKQAIADSYILGL